MAAGRLEDLRLYLRQQPVMLALLAVLAVIFFSAVTGLSSTYHAQREALGDRWFSRGGAGPKAGRFDGGGQALWRGGGGGGGGGGFRGGGGGPQGAAL